MARGTLSRHLVTSISALVAVIAILLGALSSFLVYRILVSEVDHQLFDAIGARIQNSSSIDNDYIELGGLPLESVVVVSPNGGKEFGSIEKADRRQNPSTPDEVNAAISQVPADQRAHTISLPSEMGSYRVASGNTRVSVAQADGKQLSLTGQILVGIPMNRSNQIIQRLVIFEAILAVCAIVATRIIAYGIVSRSLGPLNRLATTADEVSAMDLERGQVNLPPRISADGADPNNEVVRVSQSFNRMLDNIERALASREESEQKVKQFVADASHELRNPLASIRGYAELTQRRGMQLDTNTAFAMSRISNESQRMSELVEDMLLLARLDTKPTMQLTETDVVEVVLNAVSDAQAAGPDHDWHLALPQQSVTVMADHNQLYQAVANLLSNARKHTPSGTKVTTSIVAEDGQAVIKVHDDGPGVPTEIMDKVFERFARADAARTYSKEGSTGLGLAIVSAVMTAHKGSASLDTSDGHTTFVLRLPLAPEKPAPSMRARRGRD